MFVSVMIGGGMLYIDDKARGVHEGYLVTPITRLETGSGTESGRPVKSGDGRVHADHPGFSDYRAGLVVSAVSGCCSGFC